ncbi:MAG: pseudouridine synthase [Alphaproteobacteria bacterium]
MAEKIPPAAEGERIAKVMARSGLCSRRDAERMIGEGRVTLGGAVVETPATIVGPKDLIAVDGKPLPELEKARLWRYHKPDGLVTTHRDEKGRPTVFDRLPAGMPRVISIGRLDLTSEGLLLLTNDGGLARMLELPSTGWKRRYRARVYGTVTDSHLARLAAGITVDGVNYGPIEAVLEREQGDNAWLAMSLREGKNREIRKVLEHLGLQVNRLIRIAYGPFQLGNLPRGEVEEVKRGVMRAQLGHLLPDGGTSEGAAVAKPKPKSLGPRSHAPRRPRADASGAAPGPAPAQRTPRPAKPAPRTPAAAKRSGSPTKGGNADRRRRP